jgi:hypothetical protein
MNGLSPFDVMRPGVGGVHRERGLFRARGSTETTADHCLYEIGAVHSTTGVAPTTSQRFPAWDRRALGRGYLLRRFSAYLMWVSES